MKLHSKILLYIILFIAVILTAAIPVKDNSQPKTGFWAMEGTLTVHNYEDETDPLSGPEIYELRDDKGLTIWFGRYIFRDVCLSGQCNMIRLWLFWDGVGNYLGMQIPDNEPLTKSDHSEFEGDDYEKLDNILRDTSSILKNLRQEDLVIIPDTIDPYNIDGYTAATQPTLAKSVVKDAVFTCYTLWHAVYGQIQTKIFHILEERISKEYLENLFASNKENYIKWAIKSITTHEEFHTEFYPEILNLVNANNDDLANQALDYFQPKQLTDTAIQKQLVKKMVDLDAYQKNKVIWKFIELENVDDQVVYELLNMVANNQIESMSYNYILRLIHRDQLKNNEKIIHLLHTLVKHENPYIKNLTRQILNDNQ